MTIITAGKTFKIKRYANGELLTRTGPYKVLVDFDMGIEYRRYLKEEELNDIIDMQGFDTMIPTADQQRKFINWLEKEKFILQPESLGDVTFEIHDGKLTA
ncbi:hypothetical protein [Vibrio phage BONAISHI]|nr:hypothetical protein [Vibrio phage BONAISHI]